MGPFMTLESVGTGRTLYVRPEAVASVVPHTELAGAAVVILSCGSEFDVRGSCESVVAAWTGQPVQIRKSA